MTTTVTSETLAKLGEPTPLDEIKKRPIFNKNKEKIGELDYIDARYVMDRLDNTVGAENWSDAYRMTEDGKGVVARICIRYDGEWVCKEDVGTESTIEEVKGSYSDAFKRAAVKWGIARDLYDNRESSTGSRVQPTNGHSSTQTRAATGRPTSFPVDPEDAPWVCPVHHGVVAWPAGTSAAGRAYEAFYSCPEGRSCDQRPPYGLKVNPRHLLRSVEQQEVPFS
jgi:Rad52/22 family double-strand break repair protein